MSWRLSVVTALVLLAAILIARLAEDAEMGTASWDAARAAGFAGYALLWGSTVAGMALSLRIRPGGMRMTYLLESHRVMSALALAFVAGHLVALLVGPVIGFAPWDLFAGLTSSYRPVPLALGAAALWLSVIVLVSTGLAHTMRWSLWRRLHYLAFPAWGAALVHGITAGSDAGSTPAVAIYAFSAATVAALATMRLYGRGWVEAVEG